MKIDGFPFVYCPANGARWVDKQSSPSRESKLGFLHWENNSMHILPLEGCLLSVLTLKSASKEFWYRDVARRVMAQIAYAMGGVAWDENGNVSLCVSHKDTFDSYDHLDLLTEMVMQGLAANGINTRDKTREYMDPIAVTNFRLNLEETASINNEDLVGCGHRKLFVSQTNSHNVFSTYPTSEGDRWAAELSGHEYDGRQYCTAVPHKWGFPKYINCTPDVDVSDSSDTWTQNYEDESYDTQIERIENNSNEVVPVL